MSRIQTQAGHAPSRDWLSFTKSSRARNKIKHWINEHQRERAIEIGRKLLEREARKYKVALSKFTGDDYIRVAAEYGLGTEAELLAAVGFGKYSTRVVLNKLEPGSTITAEPPAAEGTFGNAIGQMSEAVKKVFFGKGSDSLQVERPGRPARLSCSLLQPYPWRRDHRLRDPRQGRRGPRQKLSQCAEPALRVRPPHSGGVGRTSRQPRRPFSPEAHHISGPPYCTLRRPRRRC